MSVQRRDLLKTVFVGSIAALSSAATRLYAQANGIDPTRNPNDTNRLPSRAVRFVNTAAWWYRFDNGFFPSRSDLLTSEAANRIVNYPKSELVGIGRTFASQANLSTTPEIVRGYNLRYLTDSLGYVCLLYPKFAGGKVFVTDEGGIILTVEEAATADLTSAKDIRNFKANMRALASEKRLGSELRGRLKKVFFTCGEYCVNTYDCWCCYSCLNTPQPLCTNCGCPQCVWCCSPY